MKIVFHFIAIRFTGEKKRAAKKNTHIFQKFLCGLFILPMGWSAPCSSPVGKVKLLPVKIPTCRFAMDPPQRQELVIFSASCNDASVKETRKKSIYFLNQQSFSFRSAIFNYYLNFKCVQTRFVSTNENRYIHFRWGVRAQFENGKTYLPYFWNSRFSSHHRIMSSSSSLSSLSSSPPPSHGFVD
jgi:hypothetical protein